MRSDGNAGHVPSETDDIAIVQVMALDRRAIDECPVPAVKVRQKPTVIPQLKPRMLPRDALMVQLDVTLPPDDNGIGRQDEADGSAVLSNTPQDVIASCHISVAYSGDRKQAGVPPSPVFSAEADQDP